MLGNLSLNVTCFLVDLVDKGTAFLDISKEDFTGMLCDDRFTERVKLDNRLICLNNLVAADIQLTARSNTVVNGLCDNEASAVKLCDISVEGTCADNTVLLIDITSLCDRSK